MITDVNVHLSRWPFRRLPHDQPEQLVRKLRSRGITSAWVGSFDGLLHKDISAVNLRVADECRQFGNGLLEPVGTVNPMLPAWEEDLRRCRDDHQMRIIRLYPNYHEYQLDDALFTELLIAATEHKFVVQIAIKMEDERTHHPLVQVAPVDTTPLVALLPQVPGAKVMILNGLKGLRGASLTTLANVGNVSFEISMLEGVGGIENVLKLIPVEKLLFGSYFPFFYLEAALLKLRESELGNFRQAAILHENAKRLLNA